MQGLSCHTQEALPLSSATLPVPVQLPLLTNSPRLAPIGWPCPRWTRGCAAEPRRPGDAQGTRYPYCCTGPAYYCCGMHRCISHQRLQRAGCHAMSSSSRTLLLSIHHLNLNTLQPQSKSTTPSASMPESGPLQKIPPCLNHCPECARLKRC